MLKLRRSRLTSQLLNALLHDVLCLHSDLIESLLRLLTPNTDRQITLSCFPTGDILLDTPVDAPSLHDANERIQVILDIFIAEITSRLPPVGEQFDQYESGLPVEQIDVAELILSY